MTYELPETQVRIRQDGIIPLLQGVHIAAESISAASKVVVIGNGVVQQ